MPRIVLLGCGCVGYGFACLANGEFELNAYDASSTNLARVKSLPGVARAELVDLSNPEMLRRVVKEADLVVDALPGRLGFKAMSVCAEECVDVVSVSYTPEDPLTLDSEYRECGAILVPDSGFAPGISNLLVGRSVSLLGFVDEVFIHCGGLPERPVGPLGYAVRWSPEDLLDEYVRPARVLEGGKVVELDPLSRIEVVKVPGVGVFEAFYTDGLRTMLATLRGKVGRMAELTLRYRGHAEKIKLLRDLGLLSGEPVKVGGVEVAPKKFLAAVISRNLGYPQVRDVAVLYVVARSGERRVEYVLYLKGDEGLSAMSRATGSMAYAAAKLILDGTLREKGVVPPELLGMNKQYYARIMKLLEEKGVNIRFRETRSSG